MYLVSIKISNLRAIHSMTLDFTQDSLEPTPRRWTVLLGENGCGKSSVLKAIGLALAGSDGLQELLTEPDEWIRNGADVAKISLTVHTAENRTRTFNVEIRRGEGRSRLYQRNAKGLAQLDAALNRSPFNYFIAAYGTFRRPPDAERGERTWARKERNRTANLGSLFSGTHELIGLEQWARQLDYRSGEAGRTIVSSALEKLLPGMTFHDIDKSSGQIVMKTVDGNVALRQLSEGYQAMAAWAGDLLFRMNDIFTNHKDPLTARGVLLLDEMDLHLHPVWKRRLVDFIDDAFPNLQIVATTHSPLSIQQCGEGELFVVRREDEGPTLIPFSGDPSKLRLSELFLSPLVGLETLDSPRVEELRDVARTIELRPGPPSPGEAATLHEIAAQLEGVAPIMVKETPGFDQYLSSVEKARSQDVLVRIAESTSLFESEKSPTEIFRVSTKRRVPQAAKVMRVGDRGSKQPTMERKAAAKQAAAKSATEKTKAAGTRKAAKVTKPAARTSKTSLRRR